MAKSQDTETLGQRIARLRREKGLTQAELAQRLQVSQPVVSDYENGVIRLPADVVVQIAEILDASTDVSAHAGDREAPPLRSGSAVAHDRGVYHQDRLRIQAMNARSDEVLIEKLKSLPPQQRAEVEDFVDFLKTREERARDEAAQRLGNAFEKLDALNLPPLTPEEVQAEIDATRRERAQRR